MEIFNRSFGRAMSRARIRSDKGNFFLALISDSDSLCGHRPVSRTLRDCPRGGSTFSEIKSYASRSIGVEEEK